MIYIKSNEYNLTNNQNDKLKMILRFFVNVITRMCTAWRRRSAPALPTFHLKKVLLISTSWQMQWCAK